MRPAARRAVGVVAIGVWLGGTTAAQTPVRDLAECSGQDLRGFTIREARLDDPFSILRWRRPGRALQDAIAGLKGQPYTFEAVEAVSTAIESKTWLPDNPDALVQLHYSDIGVVNCRDRQLDVLFRVFSAAPSPTLSAVFEWDSQDKTADEIAGLARTRAAWKVAPEVSFDRARNLSAGGRLQGTWSNGRVPFGTLSVEATGSTDSHVVAASLSGGTESLTSWLQRASWRVEFGDSSMPAGADSNDHLDERAIAGEFSAVSRPLKGVVARAGGILNGGRLQSGFFASQLPVSTVPDSDFTASTLFLGLTGRQRQQAFAASYALMFGATGRGFHGDWRKQIGDVAHEAWFPVGDHRLLEFEQRLTLGRLETLDTVPVTERFFGGAGENMLSPDDQWRIPAGPRIRSIPTNRLALAGSGGDRFVAYNSTTAFTVWRKPALPNELLREPGFDGALRLALTGSRATLDATYRSGDPSFQQIKASLPEVVAALQRVATVEAAARSSRALPDAAFTACEEALQASRTAARHAQADKPAQAYGWVKEMLPDGDNALATTISACGADLVAPLKAAGAATGDLESAANDLRTIASTIDTRFAAIDDAKWSKKADTDLAYAQRALDVIVHQLNITAVSPVFVFDAVQLGPGGGDPHSGKRYAIGGGIRLTLASTVNMTLTFAVNPQRRAGEGSSALVFALTTRNLFD